MKDLSKFQTVKQALEQVVSASDVNNGTQGVTLVAHYWQHESIFDRKRQDLQTLLAKAVLTGQLEDVKTHQKELEKLPKSKIVMEFRLLEPIPRIQGTKVMHDGEKTYKISMENVTSLFVPEDAVHLGLLEYEETADKMTDAQGKEATVIKLHIKKGIIDVAAPITDNLGKIMRPKRAYVTAISYHAMQIAGRVMNNEKNNKRRMYGFEQEGLMMNNPL